MGTPTTLNTKQRLILNYITECIRDRFYTPSVREIGNHVGLSSTSTVHSHLATLERLGYIERDAAKKRSITVKSLQQRAEDTIDTLLTTSHKRTLDSESIQSVPLLGAVQAGTPITAITNYETEMPLPTVLTGFNECFMLRVQGESMIDIGMYEGDLIVPCDTKGNFYFPVSEQQALETMRTIIENDLTSINEYYIKLLQYELDSEKAVFETTFSDYRR